jgi:signal transduction histidine kinase
MDMKEACQEPDATRLKQRVDELEAELAQLSYAISHDLRAPLRAVLGFAEALLEDFGPALDPAARNYAQRVAGAARKMEALIQALLAYSRLSKGEVTRGPVDLEAAVTESLQPLIEDVHARGGEVVVDKPLPRVLGQHAMLVQALSALLGNAVKFVEADQKPQVCVRAEARGGDVRLWVEDNGIGIAPEQHERVFGVFERLHAPDKYPGTGIGLALARRAIGRLAGRVGIESAPGRGSRFWIELPAVRAGDPETD